MDNIALARQVASDAITALGMDRRGWVVLSIRPAELPPITPPRNHLIDVDHVVIDIGQADERLSVHFMSNDDRALAIVATASQIQDHVIEFTGGEPLPRCPGHQHPLTAQVVSDTAFWVCPEDGEHYSSPILQNGY